MGPFLRVRNHLSIVLLSKLTMHSQKQARVVGLRLMWNNDACWDYYIFYQSNKSVPLPALEVRRVDTINSTTWGWRNYMRRLAESHEGQL